MQQVDPASSRHGVMRHGVKRHGTVRDAIMRLGLEAPGMLHRNLPAPVLIERALRRGEGTMVMSGALATRTDPHTGRSPRDRFILDEPGVHDAIDWGQVNQPIDADVLSRVWARADVYARRRELFVQDLVAGADPAHRLPVRVITESAWHSLFARNMFRLPERRELENFRPGFTVLDLAGLRLDPRIDGTNSPALIALDFAARTVLIAGTRYAGEIKKSIFSVLNHLLPDAGVLPMHCSANVGRRGDVAVFFGLSGTGKTTLSADRQRTLIGDDEHGWGKNGIFNFEGGCYAKVIRLSPEDEPLIYDASTRFGAILENVVADPMTGEVDFDDDSITENTRSSYPLHFIPNASAEGMAGHPSNIVMLAADAFGVLPPISRLTPEQAMYHFLSGYTARIAGTEAGVDEPQATFSACFGAPFMPRHPTVYAQMLRELMQGHDTTCWLVNTGWTGGPYGVGERMRLRHTRAMLQAALEGGLDDVPMRRHPSFGLLVPEACPGVPADILDARATWADPKEYDRMAREVVGRFESNFKRFAPHVDDRVKAAGLHAAA